MRRSLAAAALLTLLCACTMTPPTVPSAAQPSPQVTMTIAPTLSPTPSEDLLHLVLKPEAIDCGMLVLVNAEHGYSFAENVNLINLDKHRSDSYMVDYDTLLVCSELVTPLNTMLDSCAAAIHCEGLTVISGYRTKAYQKEIFDGAMTQNGETFAKKYVAAPGYSEHHTGLSVDFGIKDEYGFENSETCAWLTQHAHEYGFILRYAPDKEAVTKISAESWHFRYVGVPHAEIMTQENLCLEEYLEKLITISDTGKPLKYGEWDIYRQTSIVASVPKGCEYTVSGDNMGGFVLAVKMP